MIKLINEPSQVEEVLSYFSDKPFIQVDTEDTGRDCHKNKIILLQLGDYENQFVIDCRKVNILLFKDILETKNLILQNSKFDFKFLKKAGIVIEHIYDTMLAECVIFCGYPKFGYSLKDLHKRYLDIELSKEVRQSFSYLKDRELSFSQIEYAAKDVMNLENIKNCQEKLIKKYGLEYCLNLENEVVKAFGDIEYNGMYLNTEQWSKNCEEDITTLKKIKNTLNYIVITDPKLNLYFEDNQIDLFATERKVNINYSSPLQMKKAFQLLGYKVDSTDNKQLVKLLSKHSFFTELQNYREMSKRVSTYGYNFINLIHPVTKRIHTEFWQVLN